MKSLVWVVVGIACSLTLMASSVRSEVVRPGDRFTIRLSAKFNAATAHTGDGVAVTMPKGFQADPSGSPEIPRGTEGVAVFRLVQKSPTALEYDFSSFLFNSKKAQRIEIKTALSAADANAKAGTLTIQKASLVKKALLPPLFGFLIWKDSAILPAGKEIQIEVAEQKSW